MATPNYGFEKRQKELAKKKKKEDKLKLKSEIKSGLRAVDLSEDEPVGGVQDNATPFTNLSDTASTPVAPTGK